MPKYGYLVVEGPHDVAFAYRLLHPFGMRHIQYMKNLDPFFKGLVPTVYPPDDDLKKRVPVPLFLQSDTHAIAIHSVEGDTKLINAVEENRSVIDYDRLTGVGVFLDADNTSSPADRYTDIRDGLRAKNFAFPDGPGVVSGSTPRLGAYVLPDNQASGTLEDLLLECGRQVYPELLLSAETHVDAALQDKSLTGEELKAIRKPAGRNKAIIGSMASILRPGRAVQVSLQDNRWLKDDALTIPRVKAVRDFLRDLFEIQASASS